MGAEDGTLSSLIVDFRADLSGLQAGGQKAKETIKSVDESAKSASGGLKEMAKNAFSFAGGMALFSGVGDAFGFIKDQLHGAYEESVNAQQGMAQTVAVLKSTHDASGETAQSVADLATQFSHLTMFSDDTVQAASNMLLTFTSIGKDVFPQATKTVLDMSQALGQDTKSSAIQLGKALNDPITGITALQRVGVTFDATQKNLIATYVQHGQTAKAQAVILKELQREFGNSAEAAGKTFGGQLKILGQNLDDIRQNIGDALMPELQGLTDWVSDTAVPLLGRFSDWFTKTGVPALKGLAHSVQQDLMPHVQAFGTWIQNTALPALERFGGWFTTTAVPAFETVAGTVQTQLLPPLEALVGNVASLAGHFSDWFIKSGLLQTATRDLGAVLGPLIQDVANFVGWLDKGGPGVTALGIGLGVIGVTIAGIKIVEFGAGLKNMFDLIRGGNGLVQNLGEKLMPNLSQALKGTKAEADMAGSSISDMGSKAKEAEGTIATQTALMKTDVAGVGTTAGTAAGAEGIGAIGPAATGAEGTVSLETGLMKTDLAGVGSTAATAAGEEGIAAIGPAATDAEITTATATTNMAAGFSGMLGPLGLVIGLIQLVHTGTDAVNNTFTQDQPGWMKALSDPFSAGLGPIGQVVAGVQFLRGQVDTVTDAVKGSDSAWWQFAQDAQSAAQAVNDSWWWVQNHGSPEVAAPKGSSGGVGGHHPLSGHAMGGTIGAGQWGIVGEQGPELVKAGPTALEVFSNPQSAALLAGRGGPSGSGSRQPVQINLEINGQTFAQATIQDIGDALVHRLRLTKGTRI